MYSAEHTCFEAAVTLLYSSVNCTVKRTLFYRLVGDQTLVLGVTQGLITVPTFTQREDHADSSTQS